MKTPRRICTQEICGGTYAYFGVQGGLIQCINKMDVVDFSEIKLNVKIDGFFNNENITKKHANFGHVSL